MVIYVIVNIIGPLFTHFGLVSCLCLNQWPFSQSDIRAIISAPYLFGVVTFVLFAVATPNKYGDLLFESRVTSRRLRELAFLMTPSVWTMSCHVLIMDDGRGWKHHRGTHKFLCRMDNFSSVYFNYIDINYIYINRKNWLFYMTQWKVSF